MTKKIFRPLSLALFSLILALGASSSAFGAATITINNINAPGVGFNDTTPAAPVGGNTGTTLGEQRLIAFTYAANIWGSTLTSTQPITINAQFSALACTATTAVLGSAGAITIHANFLGAPFTGTWYNSALGNKLFNGDLNGATADINANFNVNLGANPTCLPGTFFYLGLDSNHGSNIDFVVVLEHEMAHGLGFQTFTNASTGAFNTGLPSIYDRFLVDDSTGKSWFNMTNAERAASALNSHKLAWNGPQVGTDVPSVLSFGIPIVTINSPAVIAGNYDAGGASFGAALTAGGVTGNLLLANDGTAPVTDGCEAFPAGFFTGQVAVIDRGTCTFVVKVKNAQDAGAIAVIIADSVAGSPPAGLGGTDPTITIPSVRVTLADGNTIKAQLGTGVNGTLRLDTSVRAGADAFGKALLFAPNPFQSGSSVSHWDDIAFPNQLMEPAINGDLTQSVLPPQDMTFSELRDVGWVASTLPNAIAKTAGDNQSTPVNQTFAVPPTVTVSPAISGIIVTWTVNPTGAGATFPSTSRFATTTTDALGVAVAPALTANAQAGGYSMNATVPGAGTATFALVNAPVSTGATSCAGAGGNWSSTATWSGGAVPTAGDIVTIPGGCTVTIDTAAAAFSVTVNSGGILQYETTTPQTLTTAVDVTIDSGGIFQTGAVGGVTTHSLSVGGNLTNNGILDFSTTADTAGAGITFTGATNNTFGGTGGTTDVRTLTINKGTSSANTLELNPSNFTVQGLNSGVLNFLTLTNGTLKVSGTFSFSSTVFTGVGYTIPATGGFWLNNPNFTIVGQNGSPTNNGFLRITQGTFNVGTASGNTMGAGTGAVFTIEGGTTNFSGRLNTANAVTYTQSAGTVNVCTVGNAASNTASFGFTSTSAMNMNGGTINLVQRSTGATILDYRVDGILNGGTTILQIGTPATATNFDFRVRGNVPSLNIDNTTNNKSVLFTAQTLIFGSVSVPTGTTYNLNGFLVALLGPTFTNNGTVTGTTANSRFYFLGNGAAQTYTGSGVVTAPLASLDVDNALGLTLGSTNQVTSSRVILFTGSVTGSNLITLGNGGATSGIVQIGNTTTPTNAGAFDVPFTFNLGTGGEVISYLRTTLTRSTGPEINPTRTLTSMTYDDNGATHALTITGGDLTLSSAALAVTMTNGRIITGANTLALSSGTATVTRTNGYVDGNFKKAFAAVASKTFEVGTANGFSPATINATAGTFPANFTVKATQGPHPSVNAATSVQRYWTLTNTTLSSADLTFAYLLTDVQGTEANYKVIRISGGTPVSFPTSTVNTVAHTATLLGATAFSDWTVGEVSAPTAAPALISGQVTTASGAPLPGVTMYLSGARSARTITDSNGNYRFRNIDTDNFYTVTPSLVNYHFGPAERSFSLLANKTDAVFAATRDAVITGNAIDSADYFVRQHYLDFLGREPDESGFNFWSDQILSCGADTACIERRTINVSAAYFLSIEFQQTGGLVDGLYRASYNRAPRYAEFMPDTAVVAQGVVVGDGEWAQRLAANKQAFVDAWVQRATFQSVYGGLTNDGYVDTLISHTGVSFGQGERDALVNGLSSGTSTRADVLRQIAEDGRFVSAKRNEMFVMMEYFGYLRRDPDESGYQFWLNKLNQFGGNFEQAEMVKAFLVSGEYRQRFRL